MVPRFLVPFSLVHASCTISSSGGDKAAVAPARGTAMDASQILATRVILLWFNHRRLNISIINNDCCHAGAIFQFGKEGTKLKIIVTS
jgi:hypothetical protein